MQLSYIYDMKRIKAYMPWAYKLFNIYQLITKKLYGIIFLKNNNLVYSGNKKAKLCNKIIFKV